MPVLEISRDFAELEKAALALMEWSAKNEAMPEQVKHLLPEPKVSYAHREWLEFLFKVEKGGYVGKTRADIAAGLDAIQRARHAFERKNKRCRCGRWAPVLAKKCLCGADFQ